VDRFRRGFYRKREGFDRAGPSRPARISPLARGWRPIAEGVFKILQPIRSAIRAIRMLK
jgi:hypothetical protein